MLSSPREYVSTEVMPGPSSFERSGLPWLLNLGYLSDMASAHSISISSTRSTIAAFWNEITGSWSLMAAYSSGLVLCIM